MNALVTGGAGFIGSNLCRVLCQDPAVDSVRVIDDLSTGRAENLEGLPVDFRPSSILEQHDVDDAVRGIDTVVHLAARPSVPRSIKDPVRTHDVNATGTLRVLEAARRVGAHVIVASSSSVYGGTTELPKHERLPVAPLSPYAASKLASESYALAYQASFDLDVLAFRLFNVYGPGQAAGHAYAAVIPAFIDAALRGRPVPVFGAGDQSRDFTFVGSVCRVIQQAITRRVTYPTPVNLAFGTRTTLLGLTEVLKPLVGTLKTEHLPPRAGDARHSQASSKTLLQLFSDIAPTDLEEGLRQTVAWFREQNPALAGATPAVQP